MADAIIMYILFIYGSQDTAQSQSINGYRAELVQKLHVRARPSANTQIEYDNRYATG